MRRAIPFAAGDGLAGKRERAYKTSVGEAAGPAAEGAIAARRSTAASERRAFLALAVAASVVLAAISLMPREGPENYRYSFLFLVPFLWIGFLLRGALELRPAHFALGASALLLHQLGAFGCYYRTYLGIEFDAYVHVWFSAVAGLVLARLVDRRISPGMPLLSTVVVLLVGGLGAVHEVVEAASTMLLGRDHGMYWLEGDPYDTQKDLLNDAVGALAGTFAHRLGRRLAIASRRP